MNPVQFYEYGNNLLSILKMNLNAGDNSSYPGSGTSWQDLSGNSNNATLVQGPTFNSNNGGSIQFDGVNDYADCGLILNYTTGNFSFNMWVYVTSLTTNKVGQGPIIFYKGRYNVNGYYCQIQQDGSIAFITNGPTVVASVTPTAQIVAGNWYNISFVRKNSIVKIYINGIDKTLTKGTHLNIAFSSEFFTLGAYSTVDANVIYSNIRIATFMNYSGVLSSSKILDYFNNTKSIYGL